MLPAPTHYVRIISGCGRSRPARRQGQKCSSR
nr:MAG TPA: hypothetical protein [Bacteriophage sp.]